MPSSQGRRTRNAWRVKHTTLADAREQSTRATPSVNRHCQANRLQLPQKRLVQNRRKQGVEFGCRLGLQRLESVDLGLEVVEVGDVVSSQFAASHSEMTTSTFISPPTLLGLSTRGQVLHHARVVQASAVVIPRRLFFARRSPSNQGRSASPTC
jgi:hypothetical protein